MMQRNFHLDGWRGIAIIALLIGHFIPGAGTDAAWYLANAGRVGVELFFALSGCLIGQILFVADMPLRRYAIRRFARIVPSLWLFTAVAMLLFALGGKPWLVPTLATIGGWLNFVPAWYNSVPHAEFGHLWSVCLELQGYLLIGLVAAISRRSGLRPEWLLLGLVATSCLATFAAIGNGLSYQQIYWRPEHRLIAMLTSAALVALTQHSRRLPSPGSWVFFFLAGLACQINVVPDAIKYTAGSVLLSLACVLLSRCSAQQHRWMNHRPLLALGAASYSIYLWQQPWHSHIGPLHWLPALAAALALGVAMHKLVDDRLHRQVGRWLEQRLLRRPATA